MKISSNLPQFESEKVLLVVTGRLEADFFRAGNGEVEKIAGFRVEKPQYSNREGHFKTRGRGATLASKEKILQDFRREFRKHVRSILADGLPDRIYVCTPSYLKNEVVALLPKRAAARVKKLVSGNLYGRHPFEILEKIRVPK